MKLKSNVTGPKNIANFPQTTNEEEEKFARDFLKHGHGSWLDESKIRYNINAGKCFNVIKDKSEKTNEQPKDNHN